MSSPRTVHPRSALTWLVPRHSHVLDVLSGQGAFTRDLCQLGHRVFTFHPHATPMRKAAERHQATLALQASGAALPFRSGWFDVVTLGRPEAGWQAALPEAARVLRPGGHLATLQIIRDDTVPWVRRLARLLQEVDPTAMTAPSSAVTTQTLQEDGVFERVEEQTFRHWEQIDRMSLLSMVQRRPRIRELPARRRHVLEAQVGALFDDVARNRHVSLPYRFVCHRAWPDPERYESEPSVTVGIHMRW